MLLKDISCFHLRPFSSINDHFETSKKQKNSQNTSLLWLKIPKIEHRSVLQAFFVVWEKFFQSTSMRNIKSFHLRPFLQLQDPLVEAYWQKSGKKWTAMGLKTPKAVLFSFHYISWLIFFMYTIVRDPMLSFVTIFINE